MNLRPPSVVRWLVLVSLVAACVGPPPTPSPSQPPGLLPIACHQPDAAVCDHVAAIAVAELGRGPATWADVRVTCEERCGAGLLGRHRGFVTVELASGAGAAIDLQLVDARLVRATPADIGLTAVEPASARASGPVAELVLGHCGLLSGIDVGGSFWNPVGFIPDHADAVNTAAARVTFTGPDTARLQTEGGMGVDLLRHEGPKNLPGCD